MVHYSVHGCFGQLVVAEHRAPAAELDVGGHDHAPGLIGRRHHLVEEARPPLDVNRQVAELVDDQQIWCRSTETKALNQAVTRNLGRFPERYSFKLTPEEAEDVRSQIVTLSGESARSAWWRYPPRAFTEQGVAMLSAVLRGAKAVEVSIGIMDAFVEMSPFSSREDLAALLTA